MSNNFKQFSRKNAGGKLHEDKGTRKSCVLYELMCFSPKNCTLHLVIYLLTYFNVKTCYLH